MNVIFLDFDGVLNTLSEFHLSDDKKKKNKEKRIKILSDICKKYNCKIVIEASVKDYINEITLETDVDWVNEIFNLFKKYDIELIGRTPTVQKKIDDISYLPIWKEYEIRKYLFNHPEIDHYVVIDDDDLKALNRVSDLDKVRNHLVKTEFYSENKEEEGLLEKHIDEVEEKLKEENEIKKFALKRNKNNKKI